MGDYRKTPEVAKVLGCPYFRLHSMIRSERIPTPAKDSSGDYIWTPEDIERARLALLVDRRRKEHRQPKQEGC